MDPLEEVQNTIQQVLPIVLIGPGLVLTGCGLFIWLGGLRWLKSIAAFSAALAGLVCAWFFTEHQLVPMVLFPVILAGLGVYFHKVVVVCLGAGIAGLLVLFMPVIADLSEKQEPVQRPPAAEERMDLLESIDWVQEKIETAKQTVKDTVSSIPMQRKNLAIAAAVVVGVAGLISWRLVCAATCSVIGTTLIVCGMTMLLLYKGTESVKQIFKMQGILLLVLLGMLVSGMLIQLVLCPPKPKKVTKDDVKKEIFDEESKK